MSLERIGPLLALMLNLASLVGYAYVGRWPMVLYWCGATIINVAMLLL